MQWFQERAPTAITYKWIAKAFPRWVPVSKTATGMSLSQIESDDQNSGLCTSLYENSICRPESQHCVFCWRILAVQATLPVLKLPFVGSKNISDAKPGIVQLSHLAMEL